MKYIAISGGADSVAMVLLAHERGEDFEMLFSDSGVELPEVYWMLPRIARYVNKPLHVTSGQSFFSWLAEHDYCLPSHKTRWCTRVLKSEPQEAWLLNAGNAESVSIGIRADEQSRLKKWPTPGWEILHPLNDAGLVKPEVHALCRKHGLLNPVYEWRTATACYCCPWQRLADWRGLLQRHPALYAVSEAWEQEALSRGRLGWAAKLNLKDMREGIENQGSMFDQL